MSQFTMFGFDGLGAARGGRAKRRASGRRTKGARKMCGCRIVQVKRKGGKSTQPAIKCPDTPMLKFVTKAEARRKGRGTFCASMIGCRCR